MRILLFDRLCGGHHERYLERVSAALSSTHEVVVVAPEAAHWSVRDMAGVDFVPLESIERPSRTARIGTQRLSTRESVVLAKAVSEVGADHAFHLFADKALPSLVGRTVGAPLSLLLFRPRLHLRCLGGIPPSPGASLKGAAYEVCVWAWRRGRGAHAVLTLDPVAADSWRRHAGAPAVFLPEPPVADVGPLYARREGVVIYGAIDARKGLARAVDALAACEPKCRLVIAGLPNPDYLVILGKLVERLRLMEVEVDLHPTRIEDSTALALLAGARAVLLPYVGHVGMSRVLLEAAAAGTPVIAHDEGLIGYLVREYGLGIAVDCRDPIAFGRAIQKLVSDGEAWSSYSGQLREFASGYSAERFAAALREVFP